MHRRRALIGLFVTLATFTALAGGTGAIAEVSAEGAWGRPFAENPLYGQRPPETIQESLETPPAVSMVVLPDGRILYWGGLEGLENSSAPLALDAGRSATLSRSRVLDLSGSEPTWITPDPEHGAGHDMFCADQRLLADGTVMVAGGTIYKSEPDLTPVTGPGGPGGPAELYGSNHTRFFDAASNTWTRSDDQNMNASRWYPTLVTLPDGRVFVAGGVEKLLYNTKGFNVHKTEIYNPETRAWDDNGAEGEATFPLFARMHLLPSGDVFYSGAGQMWGPFGQAVDQALWNLHQAYDPGTNSWQTTGIGAFGARSGAFSVLLPLRPDENGAYSDDARILVGGGVLGTSPGAFVANEYTEIITVTANEDGTIESSSERAADLNNRRWYSMPVSLPDGSVLALSGADKDEVIAPGTEAAVMQPELWDGEKWTPLATPERERTYHNAAVLLPDGRVLVGGHSPINTLYGPTADNSFKNNGLGTANNFKDPSFEILEPPYLFRGDRPEITFAQKGIAWTESNPAAFPIGVDSTEGIEQVVLVRAPSTTHVTDADMRVVELAFEKTGPNSLSVQGPPNGNIAPPGHYYLFVMKDNGQGLTPSVAPIVQVGPTPDTGHTFPVSYGS